MRRNALLTSAACTASLLASTAAVGVAGLPINGGTIPSHITLVGRDAFGVADPAGTFTVYVHDIALNPVSGVNIDVEFLAGSDLTLCPYQLPGTTVFNSGLAASRTTDAQGKVEFTLFGCANSSAPFTNNEQAHIFGAGFFLGTVAVSALDLDGCNGVGAADLAVFGADFVSGQNPSRSDYDGNGLVGAGDLMIWARSFLRGSSYFSCPSAPISPR